jgi:hypothetical protein
VTLVTSFPNSATSCPAMKIKLNPRFDVFVAELQKFKRHYCKWRGNAFRAAPLEFSRLTKLLDGRGNLQMGGR